MAIHTVIAAGIKTQWDTDKDPKDFLKDVCPKGHEGYAWWYSIFDEDGDLVEQGQNIGQHAA